jgi:hypothetical protein
VRYREPTPQLDVFSLMFYELDMTRVVKGINKICKGIDRGFSREIRINFVPCPTGLEQVRRPAIDPVLMFKALVLRKIHGMRD